MHRPSRRILAAAAALVACLVIPAAAFAQKRDTTGMVRTRIRVVGVFDRQTGEPLEGVEVRDFNSGLSALTTRTGTLALLLDDTLGTLISIKKVGYRPQTLMIATAINDTLPLTVDLLRAGQLLEAMIVTANGRTVRLGPTDTIQALLNNGFYERRATSPAPSGAFITGDKLRASSLLSNARFYGRGICEANVFVDGVRMPVPKREGMFSKEGIDALLDPSEVAGLETYLFADLPSATTNTFDGPSTLSGVSNGLSSTPVTGCVTLIWRKQ